MAKWIPDGWHSVTPRLVCENPARLVQFLREVFDASGELREDRPSQMRVGDSMIMVSDTRARRATSAFLYVYVEDADEVYRRSLQAGAVSLEKPEDTPYGDRRAMIRDPFGNDWQIATSKG